MALEVIYEDQEIIVCYKPSGVPTQTKKFGQQDMESLIKNYRAKKKEDPFVGIVHRLDQPVEGVMVFAKTKNAAAELSKQVRERTISKKYYAAVEIKPGVLSQSALEAKGTLTDYIAFDQKTNVAWIVPEENATEIKKTGAKKAVLDYEFVARTICDEGGGEEDESSRRVGINGYEEDESSHRVGRNGCEVEGTVCAVDVTLHTGRHHQIRLQLSHMGWPIIGDTKYGVTSTAELSDTKSQPSSAENRGRTGRIQLGLCSYHLAFAHPKTKQEMEFSIRPKNPLFEGLLP